MPPETPFAGTPPPKAPDAGRDTAHPTGASSGRTDNGTQTPSKPGATTLHDGNELLSRAAQGAHQTIDRLADTAAPHVQRLQRGLKDGMDAAGDTVSARASQARNASEEWTASVRTTVREHPLAAVLAALAVGMIVARIAR